MEKSQQKDTLASRIFSPENKRKRLDMYSRGDLSPSIHIIKAKVLEALNFQNTTQLEPENSRNLGLWTKSMKNNRKSSPFASYVKEIRS